MKKLSNKKTKKKQGMMKLNVIKPLAASSKSSIIQYLHNHMKNFSSVASPT